MLSEDIAARSGGESVEVRPTVLGDCFVGGGQHVNCGHRVKKPLVGRITGQWRADLPVSCNRGGTGSVVTAGAKAIRSDGIVQPCWPRSRHMQVHSIAGHLAIRRQALLYLDISGGTSGQRGRPDRDGKVSSVFSENNSLTSNEYRDVAIWLSVLLIKKSE